VAGCGRGALARKGGILTQCLGNESARPSARFAADTRDALHGLPALANPQPIQTCTATSPQVSPLPL